MKCGVDDDSNASSTADLDCEIKCPICRAPRNIHALKHHLKTTHKKHKKKGKKDLIYKDAIGSLVSF